MQFGTWQMTLDQDPTWDLIVVGGGPQGFKLRHTWRPQALARR